MSADEMVIQMVNEPHERRRQLQERSKVAKRARERKARERSRRAGVINSMLWMALKIEAAILGAAAIFLILTH